MNEREAAESELRYDSPTRNGDQTVKLAITFDNSEGKEIQPSKPSIPSLAMLVKRRAGAED